MAPTPRLTLLPPSRGAVLRDGARVTIRPVVPADRQLVADAFERLSANSRYLRFLSPMPTLPQRTLDALMDVDHDRHVALIALHEGVCVGVVRYVRFASEPGVADVAITVVDATQGRGLGRTLLEALVDVAAERGVESLHFDIHPENRRMITLATSFGTRLALRDGTVSGRLALAPPALARAA